MKKRLVILGSTGSIGRSALDVVELNQNRIDLLGLVAHSNYKLLAEQVKKFNPKYVTLTESDAYQKYKSTHNSQAAKLLDFKNGLEELCLKPEADIVLNAIVGAAGLKASLDIVKAGKRLALANKESMVIGGFLINEAALKSGAEILPVDSEHSAIWQALRAGKSNEVRKIILTASGGPFFDKPLEEFRSITKEQALNHPTWSMGPKITIDSATMINKGLEVIEAMHLFNIPPDKIEVVIHPQSIIHSMVEFVDSSIMAQLSRPDMRLPIVDALFYPDRIENGFGRLDITEIGKLDFKKPDFEKFPLLKLAWQVAESGGTAAAVYNAANEVAVQAFLDNSVEFVQIPDIVISAVNSYRPVLKPTIEDILEADRWARDKASQYKGVRC